jgi:DNA uptake protein ComE-like DNA-binding protein
LICLLFFIISIPLFYAKPAVPSALKADTTLFKVLKVQPENNYKSEAFEENFSTRNYPMELQSQKDTYNKNATLFSFDPNTLDDKGWKNLGLPTRTVHIINNYRSKGGKFYKREDLRKIWGLPEGFYKRVEPYIQIPALYKPAFQNNLHNPESTNSTISIDINKADTTAFISLPGIGSKLANRIVNFRDKLGGFHSIDQIGETYGLPDSTFQKIRRSLQISENPLRTLNLNTANKDELKTHPYIRWNLANAIVEYRNHHGSFNSLLDLKKIALIDETTFNKITPYLSL